MDTINTLFNTDWTTETTNWLVEWISAETWRESLIFVTEDQYNWMASGSGEELYQVYSVIVGMGIGFCCYYTLTMFKEFLKSKPYTYEIPTMRQITMCRIDPANCIV